MELLKSEVVGDGVRGTAYGLMRVPLNVFIVVSHALDRDGEYKTSLLVHLWLYASHSASLPGLQAMGIES